MTAVIKKRPMSLRDHLLREATLLDYAIVQVEHLQSCLNVIALNYSTPFVRYFPWATALASLSHQMAEQSALLSSTASHVSKDMGGALLTSNEAYMMYCNLREAKNES